MKCEIIFIGRNTEKYLQEGIDVYFKRLIHYIPAEIVIIPAAKDNSRSQGPEEEGQRILARLKPRDFVILLDEKGTQLTSPELALRLEKWMLEGYVRLVFITGGAYGVSEQVRAKAKFILSASRFTFTHQMIRLILLEQLYRAFTILRNESYHH